MSEVVAESQPAVDSFKGAPGTPTGWYGISAGWYNVAVAMLVTMLLVGSTNYSFGLFIKPVSAEFDLGRANVSLGLIFFQIGFAVFSPFIGRIADRFPARSVIRGSGLLVGGGLITIGLTSSLPLMALAMALPVPLGTIGGTIAGVVLVSRWFTRLRGRALTISALGTSLGGLLTFPAIAFLVDSFGWRAALVITGIAIIVGVGLLSIVIVEEPSMAERRTSLERAARKSSRASDIAASEADRSMREWQVKELVRNRDFWFIAIAIALMLGVDSTALATVTPYALDSGFSMTETTLLMTATTASAIAGKLTLAWIVDRVDLRLLMAMTGAFAATLCFTLLGEPGFALLAFVSSLTGIAIGGTYPLSNALVAERFGVITLGAARGLMMPVSAVVGAGALYMTGAMHDNEGHYRTAFAILAGGACLSIFFILLTRNPGGEPRDGKACAGWKRGTHSSIET